MQKRNIVMLAGAMALGACAASSSASLDGTQEKHVLVERHRVSVDTEQNDNQIKIHIEREGQEPIQIEGDMNSPEVMAALAKLETEGVMVHGGEDVLHKMHEGKLHKDGGDNVFVMKVDGKPGEHRVIELKGDGDHNMWVMKGVEGEDQITVDIETTVSDDGKHIIIKHGDSVEEIVIPEGAEDGVEIKRHIFIEKIKTDTKDGDVKHSDDKAHKKVIVIEGGSEEEIQEKLEELGLDIKIELDIEDEDNVEDDE
jgi:hypothetical protein